MAKKQATCHAIDDRGEISLMLGGQEMVLRPSYEAIVAFETQTGKGVAELANEAALRKLKLSEAAVIACECIRAWGRESKSKAIEGSQVAKVAQLLMECEGGFLTACTHLSAMLVMAVTGRYDGKGKLKPAAASATGTTDAG